MHPPHVGFGTLGLPELIVLFIVVLLIFRFGGPFAR